MLSAAKRQICMSGRTERVTDYQERYVFLVRISEDIIGLGLDHFAIGEDNRAAIVAFLLHCSDST